jgi:hypothetical protein
MNAEEKNAHIDAAKGMMNSAIGLVIAEVFSGLSAAIPLMIGAGQLIRATGDEADGAEAEARAGECAGILAIPWPFIYIGSNAWIGAVAQLRDRLPFFIDLEPVARKQRLLGEREQRATQAKSRWSALPEAQRAVLTAAGIKPEALYPLGSI